MVETSSMFDIQASLSREENIRTDRQLAIEIAVKILKIPQYNQYLTRNRDNQYTLKKLSTSLREFIETRNLNIFEIRKQALLLMAVDAYVAQQDLDLGLHNPDKIETLTTFTNLQIIVDRAMACEITQEEIQSAAQPILEKRKKEKRTAKILELRPLYNQLLRLRNRLNADLSEHQVQLHPDRAEQRIQTIRERDNLTRILNPYFFLPEWKITKQELIGDSDTTDTISVLKSESLQDTFILTTV